MVPWEAKSDGWLVVVGYLGGGFKHFFLFTPTSWNDPNLTNIYQMGWNHQLGIGWMVVGCWCRPVVQKVTCTNDFCRYKLVKGPAIGGLLLLVPGLNGVTFLAPKNWLIYAWVAGVISPYRGCNSICNDPRGLQCCVVFLWSAPSTTACSWSYIPNVHVVKGTKIRCYRHRQSSPKISPFFQNPFFFIKFVGAMMIRPFKPGQVFLKFH